MKNIAKLLALCFIALYALVSENVLAQGQANIWYFGQNAGLDFTSGSPVVLTNSAMNTIEGCATISDASGNLLFYTDGQTVYNRVHTAMTNGTGLLGRTSSTQTAMAVNVPGSTTQYYVFTTDAEPNPCSTEGASIAGTKSGLRYSIVDMSVGANGSVIAGSKNTLIQADPIMEGMTLVPHSNGTDYWLVNHDVGTGSFKVRQITSGGVSAATTYTVGLNTSDACRYISSIKSNSCYTKLAVAYHEYNAVEVYDFNFTTGAITNAVAVGGTITFPYGIEFSPNGTYLYYTNDIYAAREVYQYNVTTAAAPVFVGNGAPSHVRIGALQLGPDGKIYVANHNWSGTTMIGVIASPNNAASAYNATLLTTGTGSVNLSQMGLPNYVKSYVSNIIDITLPSPICAGSSASYSFTYTGTINAAAGSIKWQWGDATANTLDQNPASHTYASGGTYTITLTIKDNCGVNHVQTQSVTVSAVTTPTITPTQNCSSNTISFAASGGSNYGWWNAATGGSIVSTANPYVATGVSPSSCANIWVQSGVLVSGPFTSVPAATTVNTPTDMRLYFNTTTAVDITSVSLRPSTYCCQSAVEGKSITIGLYNSSNVLQGSTVSVTTCTGCAYLLTGTYVIDQVIPVAFSIPAGSTGWYIKVNAVAWSPGFLNGGAKSTITQAGVISFTGDNTSTSMGPFYDVVYSGKTINSCNPRVASSSCCPAPVTWLSFDARRVDKGSSSVVLEWSTATEKDSKAFFVQRSLDGVHFETIAEVGAAGYSTNVRLYEYVDNQAPAGNVYYRLLQEDYDGATSNSKIAYVNGLGSLNLSLVPNPGNGSFTITGLSGDVKLTVAVYSITGQSIFTTTAYPGEVIDLEGLAKGFYVVKIISGSTEQSIRYINQ